MRVFFFLFVSSNILFLSSTLNRVLVEGMGTQTTTKSLQSTTPAPVETTPVPNIQPNASKSQPDVSDIRNGYNLGLGILKKAIANNETLNQTMKPCPFAQDINCDPTYKYHSYNGQCNNIFNPQMGGSMTPYKRWISAQYGDTIDTPRNLAVSRNDLPSPRLISTKIQVDSGATEKTWTHILSLFGQFVAHDITSLAFNLDSTTGQVAACPCNSIDPNCFPIKVSSNDTIALTCIQFTRSSPTFPSLDCKIRQREQLNTVSAFIDGTQIYGDTLEASNQLRTFQGGMLKTSEGVTNRNYLPLSKTQICGQKSCFLAGDSSMALPNVNMGTTSIHTLFVREHNRIAAQLALTNPAWNDTMLYFETRRIVIAIYQHIVYSEWVPAIIGIQVNSPLAVSNGTFFTGYNPNVNPSIANEFATAVLRFGHSGVKNTLGRYLSNNKLLSSFNITDVIYNVNEAYK